MKRKILPGIILALALGSVGVWALVTNTGSFPKFNRYYHLDDYLMILRQPCPEAFLFLTTCPRWPLI